MTDPEAPLSPDPPEPAGPAAQAPELPREKPDDADIPDGTAASTEDGTVEAPD